MAEHTWAEPWWPFLPVEPSDADKLPTRETAPDELGWDSLPFAPRVDLQPTPIR